MRIESKYIVKYIYIILFFSAIILLVYKAFHSFGHLDEQFYLSTMYRFVQGDAPLLKEWAPSQGYAIIIYPLVKLFILINKGTEGIVLAFRFLYIIMHSVVSYLVYRELKRFGSYASLLVSILYLIYVPYYIMALSYNTIGVECLTLSIILLLNDKDNALKNAIRSIFAGVSIGILIICNPFMICMFVLGSFHVIFIWIKKRVNLLKKWGLVTLGTVIVFVYFCASVFTKISLNEFLTSVPLILNDPQHQVQTFSLYVLLETVITFYSTGTKIYMLLVVITFIYMIDIKRNERKSLYMMLFSGIAGCLLLVSVISSKRYINMVVFPLCILGLYGRILYAENDRIRYLFGSFWIPGTIYSVCLFYSSTNGYWSICHGAIICLMATVLILKEIFIEENNGKRFIDNINVSNRIRINNLKVKPTLLKHHILETKSICLCFVIIALLFAQLIILIYMRTVYYYWEDPNAKQDYYLSEGPEKGLKVNQSRANYYITTLSSIRKYNNDENKTLAVLSSEEWIYLYLKNYKNGTFCPYVGTGPYRLPDYYRLNPEKKPDLIYIDNQYLDFYPMDDIILYEYAMVEQLENGAYIYEKK